MAHPCMQAPPPLLRQWREGFNAQDYFKCHDPLKALWKQETRPIRDLYKGLLQVTVGLHHQTRGKYSSAVEVLISSIDYMRPFAPVCQNIDVEALIVDVEGLLGALQALGPERVGDLDPELIPHLAWVGEGLDEVPTVP